MRALLTPGQRYLFVFLFVIAAFLLANSVFLFLTSPAERHAQIVEAKYQVSTYGEVGAGIITSEPLKDPERALPTFYQSMLAAHILGGLFLMGLALAFVFWHLSNALKVRNNKAILYGIALTTALLLLAFSGLFILTEANSAKHRWIFWSHRALSVFIVFFYLQHRLMSATRPVQRKIAYGFAAVAALLLLFLGIHKIQRDGFSGLVSMASIAQDAGAAEPDAGAPVEEAIDDPFIPFRPTNLSEPESYFFPSRATTSTGNPLPSRTLTQDDLSDPDQIKQDIAKYGFVVNDSMGSATCARCHGGIVEQWAVSTHRFSSFNNPFYKASVERIREEDNGKVRSHWCGACHDPVLMFGGKMRQEVDPLWPESQAGLTCLSCHSIDAVHGKEANGNYNISDEQPSPYLFASAKSGLPRTLHDMILKSKPTVHKQMMLQPFYRTSEYCMSCHKVSLDVPINRYKWIRGQNDYDAWHNSGVAHNAARTFYMPPVKKNCQECHMPLEPVNKPDVSAKNGLVKSHRFQAANNGLPFIRGDHASMEYIEKFMKNKVLIDVFPLNRGSGSEPAPVKEIRDLQAGEEVQVDVVVRNHGVGHTFPAGTNDSNEAWVDFQVTDEDGTVYYRSGAIREDGQVDPEAHFYKALFVDKHSQAALRRNPQNFHVLVYARVIGPGTADAVRYQFRVPEQAAGRKLTVSAKLFWRKFNRTYTEFVFEHEKLPDLPQFAGVKVPDLPLIVISQSEASFAVTPLNEDAKAGASAMINSATGAGNDKAAADPRPEWMRYNDYGIGHILQNDFRTADWAFSQVAKLAPNQVDGPRNRARVALLEGRLGDVYAFLDACETIKPGDPQTAWFWALAKKKEGAYDEAIPALQRVLAYFPEDREGWSELGRVNYLNGDYRSSLKAYLQLLAIDPENHIGHYHRMLCYRALGEPDKAAEAEKAYLKYQIDETAAEVTQKYRLEHPLDNRESQPLHVHDFSQKEVISSVGGQ